MKVMFRGLGVVWGFRGLGFRGLGVYGFMGLGFRESLNPKPVVVLFLQVPYYTYSKVWDVSPYLSLGSLLCIQ